MKGTRHGEEHIIAVLEQSESGLITAELWRQRASLGASLQPKPARSQKTDMIGE